jgi:hypothetical protein
MIATSACGGNNDNVVTRNVNDVVECLLEVSKVAQLKCVLDKDGGSIFKMFYSLTKPNKLGKPSDRIPSKNRIGDTRIHNIINYIQFLYNVTYDVAVSDHARITHKLYHHRLIDTKLEEYSYGEGDSHFRGYCVDNGKGDGCKYGNVYDKYVEEYYCYVERNGAAGAAGDAASTAVSSAACNSNNDSRDIFDDYHALTVVVEYLKLKNVMEVDDVDDCDEELRRYRAACVLRNFIIHPNICKMFGSNVEWCGVILDNIVIHGYDDAELSLQNMDVLVDRGVVEDVPLWEAVSCLLDWEEKRVKDGEAKGFWSNENTARILYREVLKTKRHQHSLRVLAFPSVLKLFNADLRVKPMTPLVHSKLLVAIMCMSVDRFANDATILVEKLVCVQENVTLFKRIRPVRIISEHGTVTDSQDSSMYYSLFKNRDAEKNVSVSDDVKDAIKCRLEKICNVVWQGYEHNKQELCQSFMEVNDFVYQHAERLGFHKDDRDKISVRSLMVLAPWMHNYVNYMDMSSNHDSAPAFTKVINELGMVQYLVGLAAKVEDSKKQRVMDLYSKPLLSVFHTFISALLVDFVADSSHAAELCLDADNLRGVIPEQLAFLPTNWTVKMPLTSPGMYNLLWIMLTEICPRHPLIVRQRTNASCIARGKKNHRVDDLETWQKRKVADNISAAIIARLAAIKGIALTAGTEAAASAETDLLALLDAEDAEKDKLKKKSKKKKASKNKDAEKAAAKKPGNEDLKIREEREKAEKEAAAAELNALAALKEASEREAREAREAEAAAEKKATEAREAEAEIAREEAETEREADAEKEAARRALLVPGQLQPAKSLSSLEQEMADMEALLAGLGDLPSPGGDSQSPTSASPPPLTSIASGGPSILEQVTDLYVTLLGEEPQAGMNLIAILSIVELQLGIVSEAGTPVLKRIEAVKLILGVQ